MFLRPTPTSGSRGNGCSTLSALLVTALARERIVNSPIGMFGLAFGKLNLDHLEVPAVAGAVCTGMRSLPGGSDPLE